MVVMTFGEKLLDLAIENAQAKEAGSGAWESMNTADEYAGRQPSEIAAEYDQIVFGLVSENKVEG